MSSFLIDLFGMLLEHLYNLGFSRLFLMLYHMVLIDYLLFFLLILLLINNLFLHVQHLQLFLHHFLQHHIISNHIFYLLHDLVNILILLEYHLLLLLHILIVFLHYIFLLYILLYHFGILLQDLLGVHIQNQLWSLSTVSACHQRSSWGGGGDSRCPG